MKQDIKNIAIVRLSALGDIVNSAVVLQFIHQFYPDATVTWISEEMFSSILHNARYLDTIHTIHLKKLKKEKSLSLLQEQIHFLRSLGKFDIVIDMQGLIKSAIVTKLVGKQTHGFDAQSTRESFAALFYTSKTTIPYEANVVRRNCKVVADALDITIDDTMILNKQPIFQTSPIDFPLSTQSKNIAFVIGASWPSKIYPIQHVIKVCQALNEKCYIIYGNEQEKNDALKIVEAVAHASLAPKMSLSELITFISNMDLVIGNDTGPTHMAWAQNRPSITLFGPTNERMIYQTPQNIAITSSSFVNILKIDKNDFSISTIAPEQIVHKAKELLYNGL